MIKPRHNKLQIPVEVSRYVYANNLVKPFAVYLYLKMYSDGKLHEHSPIMQQMRKDLRLKDDRTFKLHFRKLRRENWIGYNAITGMYFIRSIDYLRYVNCFKSRQATTFFPADLNNVQHYLVGVLISAEVVGQKYYWEVVKRRKPSTATKKWDVANHTSKVFSGNPIPTYYGLSVQAIADLLGCKLTRACVLKNAAAKKRYIQIKHHFDVLQVLTKPDFSIRQKIEAANPDLKGKVRFKTVTRNRQTLIEVVVQLYDEIISNIPFKTVAKFNNLQVSAAIIHHIGIPLQKAA